MPEKKRSLQAAISARHFRGVAVGSRSSRKEELAGVVVLVLGHRVELEIITDEQVDGDELGHHGFAEAVEAPSLRTVSMNDRLVAVHRHDEAPSKVRSIQVGSAHSSTVLTATFKVMPTVVQCMVFTRLADTFSLFPAIAEIATRLAERGIMTTVSWLFIRERKVFEPGARRPSPNSPTPRAWPSSP